MEKNGDNRTVNKKDIPEKPQEVYVPEKYICMITCHSFDAIVPIYRYNIIHI